MFFNFLQTSTSSSNSKKPNNPSSSTSTFLDPSHLIATHEMECSVCYETFELNNDSNTISTPCVNPSCQQDVCSKCIFKAIDSNIQNNCHDMKCITCHTLLDSEKVMEFLKSFSVPLSEKYDRIMVCKALENDPGFVWCAHGCGSGVISDEDAQIVTCDTCGKKTCFICKTKWHEGITCQELNNHRYLTHSQYPLSNVLEEYDDDDVYSSDGDYELANNLQEMTLLNEIESEKYIQQITKECPKCKFRFEKEENDCDHVKCVKCQFEFCWSCGADHKLIMQKDNSYHDPSCRFHSSNINQ
ncbi:hypothetical protein C9374_003476 [Naegleria lovaniensis]|uniref:RBR-type E3 ubiquitin transferase n=1 Tax=Naegleria lovaniensis TaxID=51637 RepID=A0AA88KLS9_NAELO|nr:uncharacterized protein C9374_003476 [Naegleria lovaniensis]KAG2385661.1 hypothetical protein C9374_003476 [Naegleria lovaniensis]